jgi:hypothetical protein
LTKAIEAALDKNNDEDKKYGSIAVLLTWHALFSFQEVSPGANPDHHLPEQDQEHSGGAGIHLQGKQEICARLSHVSHQVNSHASGRLSA